MNEKVDIRSIPGREGYFADADGNIYSLWVNKGQHGLVMNTEFKRLSFSKNTSGHLMVSFGRDEKRFVHRIIYETFVGKLEDGMVIRHLNDIPNDNRVCNLAQGTQKENMNDALLNGRLKTKLNREDALRIRSLKGYKRRKEVAEEFRVSESTVKQIWGNHIWRDEK